jgi:hypothetical protein
MRRTLAFLIVAGACTALCGVSVIPALAATQGGTLTSHEYAQLSSDEVKYAKALNARPVNWKALLAICRTVGSSNALLKTQRASCLVSTQLDADLANFPSHESKCGTAQPHKDVCIVPLYVGLAKDATAMYHTDLADYKVLTRRGFTGRCLDALANTAKQLNQQHQLAAATAEVTKDVQKTAKVVEGKLPSSAVNVSEVDADAKAFERDVKLVVDQTSPELSNCPHQ